MHEAWWFPVPHKTERWWPIAVILEFGRWRQDIQKFKIKFSHTVILRPARTRYVRSYLNSNIKILIINVL